MDDLSHIFSIGVSMQYSCNVLISVLSLFPDVIRERLIQEGNGVLYSKCMSYLEYSNEDLKENVQLAMRK